MTDLPERLISNDSSRSHRNSVFNHKYYRVFYVSLAAFIFIFGNRVDREPNRGIQIPSPSPDVSLANYESLEDGMSYEEVVEILGVEGVLVSKSSSGTDRGESQYNWFGTQRGSVVAGFEDGVLMWKREFDLQ